MKFGHAAVISYAINSLQEGSGESITKGINKDQARMIVSINRDLGLEDGKTGKMNDDFEGQLNSSQLDWIKDRINDLFSNQMMPVWAAKWAVELLETE